MKFSHVEGIRSLALVGATGLVGREFLQLLSEHKIKIAVMKLLASDESAGEVLEIEDRTFRVDAIDENSFKDIEVAFFSVPSDVTKKFVPLAVEAGSLVIDDSSVYRMKKEVPLVVPQVNGFLLRQFEGGILSTPNCTTTPLVLMLKPLLDSYGLKRVVVSTYQSVSGAGTVAYEELSKQTVSLLNGTEPSLEFFPHRIAFNTLPLIGRVLENGNSEEEEKVVKETQKILGVPNLKVSATAVRVPTFCGHGLSVNVELAKDFSVDEVRELFDGFPGVKVLDKPEAHIYPTNIECTGSDYTFVGRIRRDYSISHGLNFWVMTDNLRKGAALNVLECLETLYNYRRMS